MHHISFNKKQEKHSDIFVLIFIFFSLAYHYAAVMDFRFENMLTCGHECFDLYFIAKWGCGRGHLDKLRICHFSWDEISSM